MTEQWQTAITNDVRYIRNRCSPAAPVDGGATMTAHDGVRVRLAPGPRVIATVSEMFRLKPQPWTESALCQEVGVEPFIVDAGEKSLMRLAKTICNGDKTHAPCPVRQSCLEWALEVDDRYAILGGKSPRQRLKLERDRRAANGLIHCRICDIPFDGGPRDLDCSAECRLESRRRRNAKKRRAS